MTHHPLTYSSDEALDLGSLMIRAVPAGDWSDRVGRDTAARRIPRGAFKVWRRQIGPDTHKAALAVFDRRPYVRAVVYADPTPAQAAAAILAIERHRQRKRALIEATPALADRYAAQIAALKAIADQATAPSNDR